MNSAPIQMPIQSDDSKITTTWILWLGKLVSTITKNELQGLSTYADNTAAVAGGLKVGAVYKTATGQVMVVY